MPDSGARREADAVSAAGTPVSPLFPDASGPGGGEDSGGSEAPTRKRSRSWAALREAYQVSQTPGGAEKAPPPRAAEVPPRGSSQSSIGASPVQGQEAPPRAREERGPAPAAGEAPARTPAPAPESQAPSAPRVFKFKARAENGRTVEGHLSAHSAQRTADLLRQRGFTPIEVVEVPQGAAPAAQITAKGKVKRRSVAVFTRQLSILYRSGVPLVKAISTLATQPDDLVLHEVLTGVRRSVSEGYPLHRALARYPQCFPPDYVAMVEAGEAAGLLDMVLERLAENMERQVEMNSRLRSAMSYPAFVTVLAIVLNLGIFKWILPNFEPVFASSGVELPLITAIIMQVVRWTNSGWFWIALVVVPIALFWAWRLVSRAPGARIHIDQFLLRIPLYGPIYRRVILVEVFSILQNLFTAGLPVQRSLGLSGRVANNKLYEAAMNSICDRLKKGDTMGVAFNRHRELFSKLAIQMIVMGETLGKPVTSFRFLANFYKTELDYILDGLAATVEPLMVAMVGLMTGTVVLSVFLPIYRIVNSLL